MSTPHRTFPRANVLTLVLALTGLVGMPASAEETSPEATAPRHRLSAYLTSNAHIYLSAARTMGGIGGGIGVRDTLDDRFIFQADLSYLALIGNTASLRLGAGAQLSGLYAPAALLTVTTLMGDRLSFLMPEHPTRLEGPAMSLGILLAPVRFDMGSTQISLLQLGVGVGTDLPGLGVSYSLGLLEVSAAF